MKNFEVVCFVLSFVLRCWSIHSKLSSALFHQPITEVLLPRDCTPVIAFFGLFFLSLSLADSHSILITPTPRVFSAPVGVVIRVLFYTAAYLHSFPVLLVVSIVVCLSSFFSSSYRPIFFLFDVRMNVVVSRAMILPFNDHVYVCLPSLSSLCVSPYSFFTCILFFLLTPVVFKPPFYVSSLFFIVLFFVICFCKSYTFCAPLFLPYFFFGFMFFGLFMHVFVTSPNPTHLFPLFDSQWLVVLSCFLFVFPRFPAFRLCNAPSNLPLPNLFSFFLFYFCVRSSPYFR